MIEKESMKTTVRDIMTTKVISVNPETSLIDAAKIITAHNFNGVPVVDAERKLVGILTEYDLISKPTSVHLPTFQIILKNMQVLKEDRPQFGKEVAAISNLTVRDVMNDDPLTFFEETTYEEALTVFRKHHRVNPIPVITPDRHVVGIVSRFDILKPLQALS